MDLEHKQKTDLCYFHSRDSLMHMALMVGSLYREYEKNEVESTVPIKSIPPSIYRFYKWNHGKYNSVFMARIHFKNI